MYQQQQQQQQSIASLLQERSVQEEIQVAYEAFIRSVPRRPTSAPFQWQPPAHRCEDTCDFFQYRNVNICKATANWHYCTEQSCDRMIRTHERQVCPLSGMAYDLELDTGADLCYYQRAAHGSGGGGGDDESMEADKPAAAAAAEEEEDADDYGDDTEMHAVAATDEDARRPPTPPLVQYSLHDTDAALMEQERLMETDKQTEPTEDDSMNLQWQKHETAASHATDADTDSDPDGFNESDHHARTAMFESMLAHIFAAHVHTNRSLFRSIAANAERTWLLIQGSDTLKQKKRRYQPEYHLLTIVYNMCHGYNCMTHTVVPYDRWVKENIPQVRHLKRISLSTGEIKVKNFTQTSKLFRVCMTELLRQKNSNRDVLQRLQWTK